MTLWEECVAMSLFRRLWLLVAGCLLALTLLLGLYARQLQQWPVLDGELSGLLVHVQAARHWRDVEARRQSFATLIAAAKPYQLILRDAAGTELERFPQTDRGLPHDALQLKFPVPLPDGVGELAIALRNQAVFPWQHWWLALVGLWLALTLLAGAGLYRLLRSQRRARAVAAQIMAGERDPGIIAADEARTVLAAFAKLLVENRDYAKAQVQAIDQVRRRSFVDPETGLGNRGYFDAHLDVLLHERDSNVNGMLVLLELGEPFEAEAEQRKLVQLLAHLLHQHSAHYSHHILARREHNSFSALLPGMTAREVHLFCRRLLKELTSHIERHHGQLDGRIAHIGVVGYRAGDEAYKLLAEAELGVRYAQQDEQPTGWHMFDSGDVQDAGLMGRVRWRALLERVIERRKVTLHYHPVVLGAERRIAFHEVLSRVPNDDGELFTAATFLPMAQRVGLAVPFDRMVCDQVLKSLLFGPLSGEMLSVNLSADAVADAGFRMWLLEHLAENRPLAERLVFEVGEAIACQVDDSTRQFFATLNRCGASLAVEHVGQPQYSANYLEPGLYKFIKLHRSLTRGIESDPSHQDFVRGLTAVGNAAGATVLAECVESEAQWNMLLSLGVSGGQGYLFGKPQPNLSHREGERLPVPNVAE